MDLLYIAVVILFFFLTWALVHLCSKLGGAK